jgi:NADPH:quinone reductase-like Zn-dependent oxidoreductase
MPQGAYAEYVICWEKLVMPKPSHLTWVEAASIPEHFLTGGILVLPECPSAGLTSGLSLSGPHTLQQPPEG